MDKKYIYFLYIQVDIHIYLYTLTPTHTHTYRLQQLKTIIEMFQNIGSKKKILAFLESHPLCGTWPKLEEATCLSIHIHCGRPDAAHQRRPHSDS